MGIDVEGTQVDSSVICDELDSEETASTSALQETATPTRSEIKLQNLYSILTKNQVMMIVGKKRPILTEKMRALLMHRYYMMVKNWKGTGLLAFAFSTKILHHSCFVHFVIAL